MEGEKKTSRKREGNHQENQEWRRQKKDKEYV